MFKYLRTIIYLFPLFLVGIFFITYNVWAQNGVVNATVKISVCGNNIAEGGEECDNADFGSLSCSSYGFNAGSLICDIACDADISGCYTEIPPDDGGGGGGGGGGNPVIPPQTSVIFSGKAYPLSSVSILKDGQIAITTIAGPNADFDVKLSSLSTGTYNFSVYSEDEDSNRSALFTFSVYVTSGSSTEIGGIFLAPTIATDKSEVRQGDDVAIFGQSVPNSTVTIAVNSEQEIFRYINADEDGAYLHYFDTALLEKGGHSTKSKARFEEEVSSYGQSVAFLVGDANIDTLPDDGNCSSIIADMNCDARVNIVDFSIAAYWYQRSNPDPKADLNNDNKVDLIDFSIMAFHWTG
jgi:hypothetical protein